MRNLRKQLVPMMMLLALLVFVGASKAQAQVVGTIEADIPFDFHAGNARFPAGKYIVKMMDDSNNEIMEITSADGHHSAVFLVRATQANAGVPKTELIFNKYGDKYFLSEVFDEGNQNGSEVLESNYEKIIKKGGARAEQHRIPGRHHQRQKNKR